VDDNDKLARTLFVATNSNNIIQYAMLDLNEDPNYRAWRFGGSLHRNFGQAVSVYPRFFENFQPDTATIGTGGLTVYFTSDDPSNRLLETFFVPA
jgi:DeoR/GlpR family transcriptional regulator of sugar metabolism